MKLAYVAALILCIAGTADSEPNVVLLYVTT